MIDGTEKYRIPLFDGTNFDNWKFRNETLLNEMNLLEFLESLYTAMVLVKTRRPVAKQRREKVVYIEDIYIYIYIYIYTFFYYQENTKHDRKYKSHNSKNCR